VPQYDALIGPVALISPTAQAVILQSDGDPNKVPSLPKSPKAIKRPINAPVYHDMPFTASQYFVEDGSVRVTEGEGNAEWQDPANIPKILQSLSNSPLGSTSLDARSSGAVALEPEGEEESTDRGARASDGDHISLSPRDWNIAKDCLIIVHYMNDFSMLEHAMFAEARVAWIRQFGWAPSVQEMHDAKMRAQQYRLESGRHVNSLTTQQWLNAWRVAYDVRGEGTVWREQVVDNSEMMPSTDEPHLAETTQSPSLHGQKVKLEAKDSTRHKFGDFAAVRSTDLDIQSSDEHQPKIEKGEKDFMGDIVHSEFNRKIQRHSATAELTSVREVEEVAKPSSAPPPKHLCQQTEEAKNMSHSIETKTSGIGMYSGHGLPWDQSFDEIASNGIAMTKQFTHPDEQVATQRFTLLAQAVDFATSKPGLVAQALDVSANSKDDSDEDQQMVGQLLSPEDVAPSIISPSRLFGTTRPSFGRNPFQATTPKEKPAQSKTPAEKFETLGVSKKLDGDLLSARGPNSSRGLNRANASSLIWAGGALPAKRAVSPSPLSERKTKKHAA
jgi:hypothetical protein